MRNGRSRQVGLPSSRRLEGLSPLCPGGLLRRSLGPGSSPGAGLHQRSRLGLLAISAGLRCWEREEASSPGRAGALPARPLAAEAGAPPSSLRRPPARRLTLGCSPITLRMVCWPQLATPERESWSLPHSSLSTGAGTAPRRLASPHPGAGGSAPPPLSRRRRTRAAPPFPRGSCLRGAGLARPAAPGVSSRRGGAGASGPAAGGGIGCSDDWLLCSAVASAALTAGSAAPRLSLGGAAPRPHGQRTGPRSKHALRSVPASLPSSGSPPSLRLSKGILAVWKVHMQMQRAVVGRSERWQRSP